MKYLKITRTLTFFVEIPDSMTESGAETYVNDIIYETDASSDSLEWVEIEKPEEYCAWESGDDWGYFA